MKNLSEMVKQAGAGSSRQQLVVALAFAEAKIEALEERLAHYEPVDRLALIRRADQLLPATAAELDRDSFF